MNAKQVVVVVGGRLKKCRVGHQPRIFRSIRISSLCVLFCVQYLDHDDDDDDGLGDFAGRHAGIVHAVGNECWGVLLYEDRGRVPSRGALSAGRVCV